MSVEFYFASEVLAAEVAVTRIHMLVSLVEVQQPIGTELIVTCVTLPLAVILLTS